MTFSVIFVDRQVVMVRHIVSRKTRKYPNLSNEGSERTSTQTTQKAERIKLVRVLVSVYAVRGDGKASNEPVHKEKFCVPVSGIQNFSKVDIRPKRIQKPRYILYWHKDSAAQKGIGQSFDLKLVALVSNNSKGGVDVYSVRTQDSWSHEWKVQSSYKVHSKVHTSSREITSEPYMSSNWVQTVKTMSKQRLLTYQTTNYDVYDAQTNISDVELKKYKIFAKRTSKVRQQQATGWIGLNTWIVNT